jgi:L-fucose mutarotase/ribose pyranase (RbsD/FucU family)
MKIKKIIAFVILLNAYGLNAQIEIRQLIENYNADYGALERKYSIQESEEYYSRMAEFMHGYHVQLENLNFESLNHSNQIDYIAFKSYIQKEAYFLELENKEFKKVSSVTDFAAPVYNFIIERRRGKQPDAQATAQMLYEAKVQLAVKQEQLSNGKKFTHYLEAEKAEAVVKSLRTNLEEAINFYLFYDVDFTWWVEKPGNDLISDLKKYEKFLKDYYDKTLAKDDGSGIIGKPIGREALIRSLQFEFIPYTPEQLITAAEKQFSWCEQEMLKASREMGHGDNWKAALEQVKDTYLQPGEWPQRIDFYAEEAIAFIESRDLITIPDLAKETWRMKMLSAKQQQTAPFFLGGETVQIAYPVDTMSHEDKMMSMRGNNPHFGRAVVHHELIPGHHLQQFMNKRYQSHRRMFYNPFWTEGWALYWEMNLWDKDFPQTPEDKVAMLFWRMHRCARIVFSLNYHLEKMTPQQCIDYLVDKVGHERANATAEVRRSFTGGYGPLYQIAYMVGGMQFMQLRVDLVDSGLMTEKQFHDRVMQENNLPVELVRAILIDQPLSKDFKTNWKFIK